MIMMGKKCFAAGQELMAQAREFSRLDFSVIDSGTVSAFRKTVSAFNDFCVFLYTVKSLETWFEKELMGIVSKRVPEAEQLSVYGTLSLPVKHNTAQEEQKSLLKIALAIAESSADSPEDSPGIRSMVEEHLKNYAWLQVRWFIGDLMTSEQLLERMGAIEDPETQLKELEESPDKIKKESAELVEKYGFTDEEKEFVDIVKEFVFLRTYRTDTLNNANYLIMPFLRSVAKNLGVAYRDLLYMTVVEVAEAAETGMPPSVDMPARKEAWLFLRAGDDMGMYQGKGEVEAFVKEQGIEEESQSHINELRGKTAFRGQVTGQAKIINNPDDIGKVKKGDILVTVMTFPAYIAAMERAAAFVTDEGSILCHAAIVAREMHKPCVISTKIATKVFKDGEIIHVDADNGVVSKTG
ncbi:hypothetical protein KY362_07575 [Candidatus Woesearchaeota archaeon]|nr:hypothetical protein [Candidatus Woesearchaeota archaeon]